jgi:hypothetical protein
MGNYWNKAPSSRPIRYQNLSYAGSASVPSTNFSAQTYQIRVVADLGGYLTIGDGTSVSCTAQSSSMKLNSNTDEEYFSVTPGQMCAFNSTSTSSGNISICEMA